MVDNCVKSNQTLVYGTTIYVGKMEVELEAGKFTSYTYQNLINKNYIIALVSGSIDTEDPIYCRVHSSCVTSETLGSLDCDCVSQMNGALHKMGQVGGILFYLLQEGRGCGYVGKSRACMHVQHHPHTLDTFLAYSHLGMKKDYREYDCLRDILHMLNVNPNFILLSNNPDKIEGFRKAGLNISRIENIEIVPNPYNIAYLKSKQQSGHKLDQTELTFNNTGLPCQSITPFDPYHLEISKRFVHVSSYYLPIGPINGKLSILTSKHIDESLPYYKLGSQYVVNACDYLENADVLQPFWFKVSVYYDFVNQNEFVVLEYENQDISATETVIRIHSESIFNRFPLKNRDYHIIYERSLERIITNGKGKLILFYQDGRGFGLGNFIVNKTSNGEEEINQKDCRDYHAVSLLLRHILKSDEVVSLCYSCPDSMKLSYDALKEASIKVHQLIYVGLGNIELGHHSLQLRCQNTFQLLKAYQFSVDDICKIEPNSIITGMGSSYVHAKYLSYLLNKYVFSHEDKTSTVPISELIMEKETTHHNIKKLIIFSQGLSPHARLCIDTIGSENVQLVTSHQTDLTDTGITSLTRLKTGSERDTLLRIEGPFEGYLTCWNILKSQINYWKNIGYPGVENIIMTPNDKTRLEQLCLFGHSILPQPSENFTSCLIKNKCLAIICNYPILHYMGNIRMKFIEGCGIDSCLLIDPYEFAHGCYQCLNMARKSNKVYPIIILDEIHDTNSKRQQLAKVKNSLPDYPIWSIQSSLSEDFKIIEYELTINYYILQLMDRLEINQINWEGKSTQNQIYE